ncbi:WW domain binding protein VOPP1 isoform X2 [Ambystoma mexicanum]|uniref:WW domain binding protein VOPP1 isoform X2 n=1 Tax=Ambystoma mexicanum TaxID=8296 RepID=UPI0037E7C66C
MLGRREERMDSLQLVVLCLLSLVPERNAACSPAAAAMSRETRWLTAVTSWNQRKQCKRSRHCHFRSRNTGVWAIWRLIQSHCYGSNTEFSEAKKHCWYFEGLYPTYYICRAYEDCCGSTCCVRSLSIQRLWYFWFLLMMGVLFCCGAGFFLRRRMYPPPLVEEPTFNVSYTRQPIGAAGGPMQQGMQYYSDPGGPMLNPMASAFHVQPNSPQGNPIYPPPPSYCNTPPPPYEQVVKDFK